MRKWKIIIVTASILLLSTHVYAQHREDGKWGKKGHFSEEKMNEFLNEMKDTLKLSDKQYQELYKYKQNHYKKMKSQREDYWAKKKELKDELHKDKLNMKKVKRIHSRRKKIKMKMMDERLDSMLKMREILTTEQFQSMHEHIQKRKAKYKKGSRK